MRISGPFLCNPVLNFSDTKRGCLILTAMRLLMTMRMESDGIHPPMFTPLPMELNMMK